MKITTVYTRGGDKGRTSLVGGQRISKASNRLEAYGTIDELSAHLGLLASMLPDGHELQMTEHIQSTLFNVGTMLATLPEDLPGIASARLPDGSVELLEQEIDRMTSLLPAAQGFVLSGGTRQAAQAHVCRTVCRRAERCIVALASEAEIPSEVQRYINRLSDYLFVLAKMLNFLAGQSEKIWHNACR